MSWRKKYRVIKVVPGPVVTQQFGKIDLSSDKLDVKMLDILYEAGCPYLEKIERKKGDSETSAAEEDIQQVY